VCINPGQARASAVRDQDATFASNDARRFWKAAQRGKVPVSVSVNHLKAVPGCMRNENAASLGFKSPVVKC
jgi:hypothetical protein